MNADVPGTIASMPRGGPKASWLDRRFQTDELEYLDRDDAPDEVKQKVIRMLDRLGGWFKLHEQDARTALGAIPDIPSPRILELGAGHGKLSAKILILHPTASVTVSDLDPTSVANIASGELGTNPRVRTQVVDATAIDAEDDSYDLVVFAQAFHHLPPAVAYRAIAEATRVGKRFLVIDLERRTPLGFLLFSGLRPLLQLLVLPSSSLRPLLHDGYISALRAYSPPALEALGRAADPAMRIEFLPRAKGFGPKSVAVLFSRLDDGEVQSTSASVKGLSGDHETASQLKEAR
jgi:SAM-dependent methyltransferase